MDPLSSVDVRCVGDLANPLEWNELEWNRMKWNGMLLYIIPSDATTFVPSRPTVRDFSCFATFTKSDRRSFFRFHYEILFAA